jgi:hypothetical protein
VVFERQSRSQQTVRIQLDSAAFAEDAPSVNDAMVRIYASVANHFLAHAWNTMVAIDAPWASLHPSKRTTWLDHLAGWEPTQLPEPTPSSASPTQKSNSLNILVTSAKRWNQQHHQSIYRSSPSTYVLLVDDTHAVDSARSDWSCETSNSWSIPTGETFEDSLRHAWREFCQASLARGVACAS